MTDKGWYRLFVFMDATLVGIMVHFHHYDFAAYLAVMTFGYWRPNEQ